jgi:dolichyl-phosphate-mannose--protein O-mannosyl transferase
MLVDKRDLLTITVLCIVFLMIATWNLGMTKIPVTTWQTSENTSFYIDLGRLENVSSVYFLVKFGNADVTYYTGSPNNWSLAGDVNIQFSYSSWSSIFMIDRETQYVRFGFQQASIQIAEMAVLDENKTTLVIESAVGISASDSKLSNLIDEQNLIQVPPTYLSETYFDEIYFVRTAENYLKLQIPFEWTHPPLGKLIQAVGILAFGYNPFGWRIMGVLSAMLMLPLIYCLGKKLFGTWIGAFASAFLLTFDFMHFTVSRMGTADTYVVLFSIASQFFFFSYFTNVIKNGWKTSVLPLFLSTLFFSLSFSTKWTALYGFAAELFLLVTLRLKDVWAARRNLSAKFLAFTDSPFFALLGFIGIAVPVYFSTYIPDMIAGRSLASVFQLQFSMYQYHATLVATHPFASQWWSWPFMIRPLWVAVSYNLPNNMVSTVMLLGNPFVWWVGFAGIFPLLESAIRRREPTSVFIAVFFVFQWLAYIFVGRLTFIYHFYLDVPFLCLASAYFVNTVWNKKYGKLVAAAYFAGVVVLFWLFYPVISGMPVASSATNYSKWFENWLYP